MLTVEICVDFADETGARYESCEQQIQNISLGSQIPKA